MSFNTGSVGGGTSRGVSGGGSRTAATGTSSGGGVSPLAIASGVLDTIGGIASGIGMGKFDYGQANYTPQQAGEYAASRAKAFTGGIPIVGGIMGGIMGAIFQNRAKAHAEEVLANRESKMNQIAQYQANKLKDNKFFQNSNRFDNWGTQQGVYNPQQFNPSPFGQNPYQQQQMSFNPQGGMFNTL